MLLVALLALCAAVAGAALPGRLAGLVSPAKNAASEPFSPAQLRAFTALDPIDSHTHVMTIDPAFAAMPSRLHLHILDICDVNRHDPYVKALEPQLHNRLAVVRSSQGHAALCTTFDPYKFMNPGFAATVIRQLNENLAEGAVAVKIWKNIGMELKIAKGQYVMPDDPVFEPIYRDIAAHDKTLIAHVADPTSLWQPPNPASPDYSYYMTHPEWYMYRHPHAMSKQAILALRDHLLAENPTLRVVGAPLDRFTGRGYGSSDQQRDEGVPCGPGVSHTNTTCHNS